MEKSECWWLLASVNETREEEVKNKSDNSGGKNFCMKY